MDIMYKVLWLYFLSAYWARVKAVCRRIQCDRCTARWIKRAVVISPSTRCLRVYECSSTSRTTTVGITDVTVRVCTLYYCCHTYILPFCVSACTSERVLQATAARRWACSRVSSPPSCAAFCACPNTCRPTSASTCWFW